MWFNTARAEVEMLNMEGGESGRGFGRGGGEREGHNDRKPVGNVFRVLSILSCTAELNHIQFYFLNFIVFNEQIFVSE